MTLVQKLGLILVAYGTLSFAFMAAVARFGRRRPDMHDVFPDVLDKLRCCDEHRAAGQKLILDALERSQLEAAWRMPAAVRES